MRHSGSGVSLVRTAFQSDNLAVCVLANQCARLSDSYQPADAAKASEIVVTKLITTAGRAIRTNYCYYNVLNATIAGVCNGSARNRTITADEVRRGFEQIVTDCGNNSGYHVVNNLTFSAYGLVGGIKALVPKTFDYPDFPGWSNEPETIPVR